MDHGHVALAREWGLPGSGLVFNSFLCSQRGIAVRIRQRLAFFDRCSPHGSTPSIHQKKHKWVRNSEGKRGRQKEKGQKEKGAQPF
jgi:hypothetical protein